MEHTKGKIKVTGYTYLTPIDSSSVVIATTAHKFGLVAEQQITNAEHIEKCWNSHDDLLAACNKALWYLCNDAALVLKEGDKIHDVLSKAIAKAQ